MSDQGRAWVIGAGWSNSIGWNIASDLRGSGWRVTKTDRDSVDVRVREDIESFVEGNRHDPFDLVVYSAGVSGLEWIGAMDDSTGDEILHVNYRGFVWVLDAMAREPRACSLIAISSDAATRPMRTSLNYCASKAALDMAIRCAARELGPKGYAVNGIAPGMTEGTGMTQYIDHKVPQIRGWTPEDALAYERTQEVVPGRVRPSEIAAMAVSIAAMTNRQQRSSGSHLNGAIIPINGGR